MQRLGCLSAHTHTHTITQARKHAHGHVVTTTQIKMVDILLSATLLSY